LNFMPATTAAAQAPGAPSGDDAPLTEPEGSIEKETFTVVPAVSGVLHRAMRLP
jgi:hypothetical protein